MATAITNKESLISKALPQGSASGRGLLVSRNHKKKIVKTTPSAHETQPDIHHQMEMFRSISDNSPDIILRFDSDARLLYANLCSEGIFGLKPDLVIGKTCHELGLPEAFCGFWSALIGNTLRSGCTLERNFHFQTPKGIRHFEVRTAPERPHSGGSQSVIATVREATRHRMEDSEIVEAGQRLIHHTNNSPLAVFEFDTKGRCLSWNHRAEEIFGQPNHSGGKPLESCISLVYPEDRPHFQQIHDLLRNSGQSSAFASARFIHRNGNLAHGEWYLSALLDEEGVCRSILCFLNDVTDRERAEQALIRVNNEQEEIIRARTAMLRRINDDLQEEIVARQRLERDLVQISEREHRRLGHDLHDGICQELAGIHFSIEAIMKRLDKRSPARPQLETIAEAVRRATRHTRLLSRGLAPPELESGNLTMALGALAAETQSLFRIECSFESIGCNGSFDPHLCANLFRIAQEAVQNAIKHGASTRIRIQLDCSREPRKLTVTDNGTGIDRSKPSGAEGNGMGLAIMKHRAQLINGTVSLLSPNGGGTSVHCVFKK